MFKHIAACEESAGEIKATALIIVFIMHLNTFETMNVKTAFQLFSHKFVAAMETADFNKMLQDIT